MMACFSYARAPADVDIAGAVVARVVGLDVTGPGALETGLFERSPRPPVGLLDSGDDLRYARVGLPGPATKSSIIRGPGPGQWPHLADQVIDPGCIVVDPRWGQRPLPARVVVEQVQLGEPHGLAVRLDYEEFRRVGPVDSRGRNCARSTPGRALRATMAQRVVEKTTATAARNLPAAAGGSSAPRRRRYQ